MSIPDVSELACVNRMLLMVGEAPVAALDDLVFSTASIAYDLLLQQSLQFQNRGSYFNTFYVRFHPDVDGHIFKPTAALRMVPVDRTLNYRLMGNSLYDLTNNTTVFTQAVECEVVMFTPWSLLPSVVAQYLEIKAARILTTRVDADRVKLGYTQVEEQSALSAVMSDESAHGQGSVFDNWTSQETLDRLSNPSRHGGAG